MPKFRISFPLLFNAEYNIEINKPDIKVAWDIYCELQTRIGVIDFVEEEDLIKICFESWYYLFKVVRNRLKDLQVPIKINYKNSKNSKNLDEILFSLLNEHMRPFLRKWHYIFNSYWESNYNKSKDPIQIQKNFPKYNLIINDIKNFQAKLKEILDALNDIVRWSKKRFIISKMFFSFKIGIILFLSLISLILLYQFIFYPFLIK